MGAGYKDMSLEGERAQKEPFKEKNERQDLGSWGDCGGHLEEAAG